MLFDVPIEAIPERYSADWNVWFQHAYELERIEWVRIYPVPLSNEIKHGAFLDAIVTNHFKARQLAMICELFYKNKVKDGDAFLFHDMWFPGLEMLAYMRSMLDINFKIYGLLHAGTYDMYDRLAQKGMGSWGKFSEKSWMSLVDEIFVATEFHKNLLIETRDINPQKIYVTGFPIYNPSVKSVLKENIVVFPHRLDLEKQPHLFDFLQTQLSFKYPDWKFIKTKDVCKSKEEYYKILAKSKIAVSFALQETWGIAMQEAVILNCIPVVPARLSYMEMYDPIFQYDPNGTEDAIQEMINLVEYFILHYDQMQEQVNQLKKVFLHKGAKAISIMLFLMQQYPSKGKEVRK